MKNLKKFFAVLVVVTLLVSSLVMPASAAADSYSYADKAKLLNDLGLYKGIDTKVFNPDLGTALNRETGVVMLLRIVGLDKTADAMTDAEANAALAKFVDAKTISTWAKKSVAYAAKNGLVVGTTTTTFSPKASLNGKAYCTLILRQLGFKVEGAAYDVAPTTLSEKGAFTAAEATKFVGKAALIKDDLVGISYGSLNAKDADGKVLFTKLVDAKVITAEAAAKAGFETAKIASATAENGKATVVFDKAPVVDPVAADFTVSQAIYGSAATTVTAAVYYTAADKTAKLEIAPVAAAAAEQKVTYSIKYKNADAVSAEFTVGALATYDVKSVMAISNNKVEVILNSAVSATNKADFAIKDAAGAALEVKDALLAQDGKSVIVTTAAMTVNTLYNLTLQSKTFKFVGIAKDTTKPKLSSLTAATRNNKVKAVFTDRVDPVTAFNVANYTISGLSILKAEFNKDASGNLLTKEVLLTTSTQTSGTVYKLVVANVTDLDGNVIDADNDEQQFGGMIADTVAPKVLSAQATTNKKVVVKFTEQYAMDKVTAETVANYTISGLSVLTAALTGDQEVTLTTSSQTSGTVYKLVIANVKDDSGNVINSDYDEIQFGGAGVDTTAPWLLGASASSNTKVKLTFNDLMDEASAETIANYAISGLTISAAELDKSSTDEAVKYKVVTLTTSAQTSGTVYKVVVTNVKDESGNSINTDNDEAQFGGMAADTTAPKLSSAVATSSTSIKVIFDSIMDDTSATQTWCYYLGTALGYPTEVVKDTTAPTKAAGLEGKVWLLTTNEQSAVSYTLDVTGVTDTSGNPVNEDNDTYTFPGIAASDATAPKVSLATSVDKSTVKITFNEAMLTSSITPSDFTFAVVSGADASMDGYVGVNADDVCTFSDDKKTVTLQFKTKVMKGVVYKVTVAGVNDAASVAIGTSDNTATFGGLEIDNPAPTVSSASTLNNQTLKLTFSEPITVVGGIAAIDGSEITFKDAYDAAAGFTGVFSKAVLSSSTNGKNDVLTIYYTNDADDDTNTDKFVNGKIYKVTVASNADVTLATIADAAGLVSLSTTSNANVATFGAIGVSVSTPTITAVTVVNENTLDVNFDQAVNIAGIGTEDVTFQKADGSAQAATVAMVRAEGDTNTKMRVFVSGDPFTAGAVYKVVLNQADVTSFNGVDMLEANNKVTFAAVDGGNDAPAIASVQKTSATTIKVVFNEKITGLDTVNDDDFTITTLPGGITLQNTMDDTDDTGKTVTITLSGALTPGTVYNLKIAGAGIMDEAGVAGVDTTSKMDFAY